ncbi:MAG TPA: M56 family metallopeptidase, partial [Pirellulales bacterium]|nr:M56 family metallopeptidase [Pirellulales bacterium]
MPAHIWLANWESIGLYWLIVWTLAATAVWGGALVLTACLRRHSAQARHRVWANSMVVALIAPLLAPLLPVPRWWSWSGAVENRQIAFAAPRVQIEGGTADAHDDQLAKTSRNEYLQSADGKRVAGIPPVAAPISDLPVVSDRARTNPVVPNPVVWRPALVAVWIGGSALSFLAFAAGLLRVHRLRRRAIRVTGAVEAELCGEICRRLEIRRTAKLLVSTQASVPFLTGMFNPAIVLPVGCARWGIERLRVVLTHELIHLKRHDVIWEILAQLAKTPVWFHPLGWFAAKRLRIERELACDDAVLLLGTQPADYAEQLVEVAAELHKRAWRPAPVVAMAGASPIERRVRSILDPRIWRSPLGRRRTIGLALGMSGLVLAVAALSPSIGDDKAAVPVAEARERVLQFPGNRTIGVVFWRKSAGKPSDRLWMYGDEWKKMAEARGEVQLPADGEVRLDINKAASTDLSCLDRLQPDDVRGLNCDFTDVDDGGLRHIGRLSGLRMLGLRNTPITDADGKSFAGLKKLQWICLDACGVNRNGFGVGDETLKTLVHSPELESIWLRDTKVTDAGMAALAQAKSLTDVEAAGTKVSD